MLRVLASACRTVGPARNSPSVQQFGARLSGSDAKAKAAAAMDVLSDDPDARREMYNELVRLGVNEDDDAFANKTYCDVVDRQIRLALKDRAEQESGKSPHVEPTPSRVQNPGSQLVLQQEFFAGSAAQFDELREAQDADVVIIGTGFCGYAVAKRLLEHDPHTKVVMLERGSTFWLEHFQNLPRAYRQTLGQTNSAVTYPWTLTDRTRYDPLLNRQNGYLPFFGGRSTLWSAWCPRPTEKELHGWPSETIDALHRNFYDAETLMHVQPASSRKLAPMFAGLQNTVQRLVEEKIRSDPTSLEGVYRAMAAPLASVSEDGTSFAKYSVPGDLLLLAQRQASMEQDLRGHKLSIVPRCRVDKILSEQDPDNPEERRAVALETSRGEFPLKPGAKVVLATGTLPPTTLVQNSFPKLQETYDIGNRFSAHFISSTVARVPIRDLGEVSQTPIEAPLELGAVYVAGTADGDYSKQFHQQVSVLAVSDDDQDTQARALRFMPDVVATASPAQLRTSPHHAVFVFATLGELDYSNPENYFKHDPKNKNPATNSSLQFTVNNNDRETWDCMDKATFALMEKAFSPKGAAAVEYWHGDPDNGSWNKERPPTTSIFDEKQPGVRVNALVHESSTLFIGNEDDTNPNTGKIAPVTTDKYQLRGTSNVHVTGGCLWPQGGSWNPTMSMVALALDLADELHKDIRVHD